MVGYPGAGKTTAAKLICELTGAAHLWADHERKKRFVHPTHNHAENLQLYAALNTEARDVLRAGHSVVFDTNFNFYKDRKKLKIMAAKEGARTVVVWITTPKDLAQQRATVPQPNAATRVLGYMPLERFRRISDNLQAPTAEEQPVTIDGTHLNTQTVAHALSL